MPAPIPDLNRDQTCHHYQAPSGQRCGSPALKGEYYCYHHHIKHANRNNRRVLIDPEVTCMEVPPSRIAPASSSPSPPSSTASPRTPSTPAAPAR